jgi:hypothetical protein
MIVNVWQLLWMKASNYEYIWIKRLWMLRLINNAWEVSSSSHTHTHTSGHYMSMNVVNRFISNPQKVHINATKHVYWYVKSTFEFETFFVHENNALLIRWVDANWTYDLDTRRSTTWMFFKFGHIPLSWTNILQPIITLSNTKAKYKSFFRSC